MSVSDTAALTVSILCALDGATGPVSIDALAARLDCYAVSAFRAVVALEKQGLVVRPTPHTVAQPGTVRK